MDIYVGNLPFRIDQAEVETEFAKFGSVEKVKMIEDRETGRFKGYAFVTMPNEEEAKTAIKELDQKEIGGRPARVNEARQRT